MTVVQLDRLSSAPNEPFGMITADCSNPKEIDDGYFVEQLDADQELYQVGVCVADTSKLYGNKEILGQAMARTEAKYFSLPNGEQGYEPMIDPEVIRDIEFSQGNNRGAMIVRFVVGANQPPKDVDVTFGRVEVRKNYDYREFWLRCQNDGTFKRFERASDFIIKHLQYNSGRDMNDEVPQDGDDGGNSELRGAWFHGSRINESFMVGVGHLVGKLIVAERRPGVWRVHDPDDESHLLFLPPHIANYSWEPGKHFGLGLDPYMRVTSPLRRLEDFIMCGQLKKRHKGISLTIEDHRLTRAAVRQLNCRVASDILHGPLRLTDYEVFGNDKGRKLSRTVLNNQVVPLHTAPVEDIA